MHTGIYSILFATIKNNKPYFTRKSAKFATTTHPRPNFKRKSYITIVFRSIKIFINLMYTQARGVYRKNFHINLEYKYLTSLPNQTNQNRHSL